MKNKFLSIGVILLFGVFLGAQADDFMLEDPYAIIKQEISMSSKILSFETRRISAKYPSDTINKIGMGYPGYRGPGQLVVYYPDFGRTTGTNEFGTEAVIENNVVVKLTGADSIIPKNGFVISGHGGAKKWIKDNIKIGTNVIIEGNSVIAYTTPDSYIYRAKEKIDEASEFIDNSKRSAFDTQEDKRATFYIKKAKSELKKAEKATDDLKMEYAKSSIQMSNLAIKFAMPYIQNEFKGVWLRPTETNMEGVRRTLDNIKQTGINEVFLETFFHGYTIYPSEVMQSYGLTIQNPKFSSFDPLKAYIMEAHKRKMKIHCWFESFYIGNVSPNYDLTSILSVYPSWGNKNLANYNSQTFVRHKAEHDGLFLDPANPEVKALLLQLLNEIVTKYRPDGVNLDYTRYPNAQKSNVPNFEQSNWGYTEIARERFKEIYEVDPVEITPDNQDLWHKWGEFRQEEIHKYLREARTIVPAKMLFTAVIFPDYETCLETKQQDWVRWSKEGLVDSVTPLIMTSDNELFEQILRGVKSRISGKTDVITGLFVGFMDGEPEDLLRQINVSRGLKSQGVILFDWAHLPVKYQSVLKSRVFLPKTTKIAETKHSKEKNSRKRK